MASGPPCRSPRCAAKGCLHNPVTNSTGCGRFSVGAPCRSGARHDRHHPACRDRRHPERVGGRGGAAMNYDRLAMVLKNGVTSAGRTHLVKHLRGERLTQRQAILAKCCDCMSYHVDGRLDCRMPHCSLYPFRPYKEAPTSSSKKAVSPRRRPPATPLSEGSSSDRGKGR